MANMMKNNSTLKELETFSKNVLKRKEERELYGLISNGKLCLEQR